MFFFFCFFFSACKAQKCILFMVSTEFESVFTAMSLLRHTILCFRELERMSKQCSRDQFAFRPADTVISQHAFGPGNEKRLAALHIIKSPTNGRSLVIICLCAQHWNQLVTEISTTLNCWGKQLQTFFVFQCRYKMVNQPNLVHHNQVFHGRDFE